jgi:hypothetical protein
MTNLDPDPHAVLRIRDPVPFCPLDPAWKKIRIRIRDEQPGSNFRELRNNFLVTMLKFFDVDPEWKKFGSGINIPDPQPCPHGTIPEAL